MTVATLRTRGIDRALQILQFLQEWRKPISVGELARRIGAPRSSLYKIVAGLRAGGILAEVDAEGRVFFGRAVYFYADAYLSSQPLVRLGRDEVIKLAQITGETAQLCMLLGNKYTAAYTQPGSSLFRITSEVGVLVPIPWTASGRLLLTGMTDRQIRALIPPEDLHIPDGSVIPLVDFVREVRRAQELGYAITRGLVDKHTTCLAAPILDQSKQAVATICFVVPVNTSSEKEAELIGTLLNASRVLTEHHRREC